MTRLQLRTQVRALLRDDGYPTSTINEALDRVLQGISNSGRYRFQQNVTTVTLSTNVYKYAVTTTILAEDLVVFQVGVSGSQAIITKGPDLVDGFADGAFIETGDSPTRYFRWQDEWWFDPIPNSTANNKVVSIYHYKDITLAVDDFTALSLPVRYHNNLLVYGVLADIAPALQIQTGEGQLSAMTAFERSRKSFLIQEKWEPLKSPNLQHDDRWRGIELIGNVSTIR